ncbi:hypothetical protein [Citrobacter amalonaticus]|uniref:hypothetical protein n=1 Tax=Citrobacter amalonaticus TaxID=35703 RepID=UPI00255A75FF|nr:hypothetical protein [Citrobacter amalonaticus]MDL4619738.1 hypothetical protein [Citrobacter amalonaticus]MDL4623836.1 hypothetical protein [Citrobacter amalonaticus]
MMLLIDAHGENAKMPPETTKNTTQQQLKQTRQLRLWLIIGGLASVGTGLLNIMSTGNIGPYDGGQIILGLGCLVYSLVVSRKMTQQRTESVLDKLP